MRRTLTPLLLFVVRLRQPSTSYKRTQGGQPTIADNGKKDVRPDNVIVTKTDIEEIAGTVDSTGAPSVDYGATGTGPVVVLREGKRYEGTWSRQGKEEAKAEPDKRATASSS